MITMMESVQGTLPLSARARYNLGTPGGAPSTWTPYYPAVAIVMEERETALLQRSGTIVLPPAHRMFEKPALTPAA
jgi:hypothetical protein